MKNSEMTVLEIVRLHVQRQGLDGLCNGDCGCGLEDFAPCGDGLHADCVMARRLIVTEDGDVEHPITHERIFCPDFDPGDVVFIPA
jgi:hypothetical protein